MVVVVCAVALTGVGRLWDPAISLDAQSNLVYADQVLAGRMPHRDFFVTYGPASYYVLAGAFGATEASVEIHRLVALLYGAGLALGVYACCCGRGRTVAMAAALTTVLYLSLIELTAYAWFAGLAVTLAAVALLQRPLPSWTVMIAGALVASTSLWRAEMLAVGLACALPFVVRRRARLGRFIFGFGLGLIPLAMYALVAGRQWAANTLARAGTNAGYTSQDPYVMAGGAVLVVAAIAMAYLAFRRRDVSGLFVAVFIAVQLPQLAQRPDVIHLVFVAAASIPLAVAHVVPDRSVGATDSSRRDRIPELLGPMARFWFMGVAAVLLLGGLLDVAGRPWREVERVVMDDRSVIATPQVAPEMRRTVDTLLQASGGGPVFVGAQNMSKPTLTWALFHHLLPPSSASGYFLEIPPGLNPAQQQQLATDVERADALLLTEFSDEERARLFPGLPDLSEAADDVVRGKFCPYDESPFGKVMAPCAPSAK